MKDPVIAIIGGGLGGLSFANAAVHHNLKNCTVYEQAKEFREIGAGVHITKNAFLILDQYGMKDELVWAAAEPSETYMIYRHYKTGEAIATAKEVSAPYGRRIHRAHLLDVLRHNLPPNMLKTGKHLDSISAREEAGAKRYTLKFGDGSTEEADIIVGCDGIHSKVRAYLSITDEPEYSGQVVYRALLPRSSLPEETVESLVEMVNYRGPKRHVLIFPIGRGDDYRLNIVAFMKEDLNKWHSESWMTKAPVDSLEEHVKDWHPLISKDVIQALKKTSDENGIMKQALYVREPNDKWFQDGIVLVGDSIHSTLPHQGQGTCQAVESGAALAILLKHAKETDTPEDVFAKFKSIRKERTDKITKTSALAGKRASAGNPDDINSSDFTPEKIAAAWDWITTYDVLEDVNKYTA